MTSTDVEALLRQGRTRANRPTLVPLGGMGSSEGEVTVNLGADLFGRPLRSIRDLLARADPFGLRVRDVCASLDLDRTEAAAFLGHLVSAGLLAEPDDDPAEDLAEDLWDNHREFRTWTLTPIGRILAHASGRKPSTRRNADKLVARVVKAAAAINNDPDSLWWVKEIRATGAYADPSTKSLLHVDLAVDLRPRLADPHEQRKAEQRVQDAAEDRGIRETVHDLIGYGHWKTRLSLAGKSKVIRLFTLDSELPSPVLFHEPRDLTVEPAPTPPYQRPAEPEPLDHCSWCQRKVTATRVARQGESFRQSGVGLCETCLALARCTPDTFTNRLELGWTTRQTHAVLAETPFHAHGCALCGRTQATEQLWWPAREGGDEEPAVRLTLCDVCPGLLELADRPDRERRWRLRHQSACVTGLHARLRTASDPNNDERPAKRRNPPRLTEIHQTILEEIGDCGALSPLDLARRHDQEAFPRQDHRWWTVRFRHLLDREQVVALTDDQDEFLYCARMRLLEADERELRRSMSSLHTPGPVWDGTRVIEPDPPQQWIALSNELAALSTARDDKALTLRARRMPFPARL